MLPQLEEIAAQLRAASGRARAVAALAGEARLTQRPAPGKWSVGECLTHLRVSSELYFQVWPSVLASARQQNLRGNGPFKMDFWGKILTWALEPPPRIRLRAPAVSRPPAELGPAERILPAFLESQDRLLATPSARTRVAERALAFESDCGAIGMIGDDAGRVDLHDLGETSILGADGR